MKESPEDNGRSTTYPSHFAINNEKKEESFLVGDLCISNPTYEFFEALDETYSEVSLAVEQDQSVIFEKGRFKAIPESCFRVILSQERKVNLQTEENECKNSGNENTSPSCSKARNSHCEASIILETHQNTTSCNKKSQIQVLSGNLDAPPSFLAFIVNQVIQNRITLTSCRTDDTISPKVQVRILDTVLQDSPSDLSCLSQLEVHKEMQTLMEHLRPEISEKGQLYFQDLERSSDQIQDSSQGFSPDMVYKALQRSRYDFRTVNSLSVQFF